MIDANSTQVMVRLNEAKAAGKAILFGEDLQDKEHAEVTWTQYGLMDSNEVVVVARYRGRSFAIAGPSPLLYPVMADRVFGMDVADEQYAFELSDRLWSNLQENGVI
jgi:hypothetical protein